MTDSNPKETLREPREIFTDSYEAQHRLAARIGISHHISVDLPAHSGKPKARTIARLRAFLDAKEKRNAGGDGIKPIEPVQIKIRKPTRYSRYLRLCPFCRKSHRKIQTAGRNELQGVCPKCGAIGPTRGERTVRRSMKWKRIRLGCKAPASVVLAPQSIKHSETPRI